MRGVQAWADRINQRRISLFQIWEEALPNYLYLRQDQEEAFGRVEPRDREFFQAFLLRYRNTLGGEDGKRMQALYRTLELDEDLPHRLAHRNPVTRARAAMETATYGCLEHLPLVERLLWDPKPFVAFAAARALGALHRIEYAPPGLCLGAAPGGLSTGSSPGTPGGLRPGAPAMAGDDPRPHRGEPHPPGASTPSLPPG